MAQPARVLVVLEVADEAEVPLEIAAAVARQDTVDQTVCSVRDPGDRTFELEVEPLGGRTRLDPRLYARLDRKLTDIDVIHVHPNAVGAVARGLAALRDVPVVKTEHNTHESYGLMKSLLNGAANVVSDAVVAVSTAVADSFHTWEDWLIRVGGGQKTIIHNGVDLPRLDAAADRTPPVALPDGFLVGCGGHHGPQKNLASVIEGMAEASPAMPDAHLIVTGDGPKRTELERLATTQGIDDRVTFTGYLPERGDVHAVLHRLDAFVFPSRYEGFGVAAAEAMAASVPVVASDIPVLREVIGDAGVYIDPDAPGDIAAALIGLYEDTARRTQLGNAGRERVEQRFRLDVTADAYVDLYEDLASEER